MGLDGADYSYLTKPNKDGTGFFVTFNVPFKKQDVFNELKKNSIRAQVLLLSVITFSIA